MTRIALHLIPLLLLFSFLPGTVSAADSDLQVTVDQLIGSWQLEGTSPSKNGDINPEDQSWEFGTDGMLESVAKDRRADGNISLSVKYKVENGVLFVQRAGSMTRWNRFQVLEISDAKLTLRGGMAGYMYFKRK